VQRRHQQQTRWRREVGVVGGAGTRRLEAVVETLGQLGVVRTEAVAGVRVARIGRSDADHRRGEQPLDLGHGGGEPVALPVVERMQDRRGQLVGAPIQLGVLGQAGRGQPGGADPAVIGVGIHHHEPVRLQCPQ
jgi:hypothetical protein